MMALVSWLCLLLFFLIPSPLINSSSTLPSPFSPPSPPLCHPHESSALFHFNNSFSISNSSYYDFSYCAEMLGIANPWRTTSWDVNRDCCTWSGVTCDEVTGHVIRLDLKCGGLQGILHSNSTLFSLGHLQSLHLSYNYFHGSQISSRFGRFASMTFLDLSDSGFVGQVPSELSHMSNLVTLDLSRNHELNLETSSMKRIVANLTSLTELFLSGVNMSYTSPSSFMNLSTSLTSLDLSWSELTGEFPEIIFHLPNLRGLDLSYNSNLNGSFPQNNWSSPLRNLNLSGTGFLIDLPYLAGNLKYLTALSLSYCTLRGTYHTFLGNFTQITSLDLSSSDFGGQIPWSFLNLKELYFLDLSDNNFIGQLPEVCINSTKVSFLCDSSRYELVGPVPLNLKFFLLSDNFLNGTIPSWLYSLPSLQLLGLNRNELTGEIKEFQYNSLVYLDLSFNKLHGLIPRSIFQQVNLSLLGLSSNNWSGVERVDQDSKLNQLAILDLSSNNLSLSSDLSFIIDSTSPANLQYLDLSSCNISEFPYSLRFFENLVELDISNNQIGGTVPQWLWNVGRDSLSYLNISHNSITQMGQLPWKNLNCIDMSSNRLQGHLPLPPPSTTVFFISNNKLVGGLPSSICNLHSMEFLDLSNNSLSGNIPSCTGNASDRLEVLNLGMNQFFGTIPLTFTKGNSLVHLNLHGNQFEGSLPHSLLNCGRLKFLDVGNNKINGSFPQWLESLPKLQVLILRSNRFSGPIGNPKTSFPFQKLRIIDLSNNDFTGPLPTNFFGTLVGMMDAHSDYLEYMEDYFSMNGSIFYFYQSVAMSIKGSNIKLEKIQTMFISIDFSRNYFSGNIPKSIGKLNSLKGLNFSHNMLNGNIPSFLGNLSSLEGLDLSSNELSGKIPWELATDLNQLEFLNLSNNKLEGPIPRGPQFNTFKDDSYGGNLALCGFPLSKSCSEDAADVPTSPTQQEDEDDEHAIGFYWKVVVMGYGSGFLIGISVGYMVLTDKTIAWLVENVRGSAQRRRSVKSSKQNTRVNGGIRRRN